MQIMQSKKEQGMIDLLNRESMGGNAGTYNGYPCVGLNFYFDRETGKINAFGNHQNLAREIIVMNAHGIIRVAIKMPKGEEMMRLIQSGNKEKIRRHLKIINYSIDNAVSALAEDIIKVTIQEYNNLYGF